MLPWRLSLVLYRPVLPRRTIITPIPGARTRSNLGVQSPHAGRTLRGALSLRDPSHHPCSHADPCRPGEPSLTIRAHVRDNLPKITNGGAYILVSAGGRGGGRGSSSFGDLKTVFSLSSPQADISAPILCTASYAHTASCYLRPAASSLGPSRILRRGPGPGHAFATHAETRSSTSTS